MSSQDAQDFVILEETDIRDYNEAGLLPQTPEVIAEIQKWLQPTDYHGDGSEYTKHLNSYVEGTDLWIQDTDAYLKWHGSADHGSLWIKAIAGAGKSVFAAMMAAKLARFEKVPVLFFFFRQIVDTNHDPHSLTRDWISMTLPHSPPLQAKMKEYIDSRRTLDNVSTNEFWGDLVQAIVLLPKVYCVVDALDEMDIDQESFFQHLVLLGEQKPSSVKVLMTSRPLPRIEAYLKIPSVLQIRLEQLKVDKDISLYVDYRLDKLADLDSDLKLGIKKSIGEKAQGSFLYARLMMDELLDHMKAMVPKIEFFQRSLDWLPLTLEDMYNGMLADHSLRSRVPQELQLTILRWVTHSSRPLRLLELAAMLDSLNGAQNAGKDTKAVVRTACGPLLEILDDETVSVIHHSFTEFLVDVGRASRQSESRAHPQFPIIHPPDTHNSMAFTCLKYLTSGHTDEWDVKERTDDDDFYNPRKLSQKEIKMQHPFLDYAMHNWYVHACRLGSIEGGLLEILDNFMTPENPAFVAWLDMAWPSHRNLKQTSALHVASWAGMTSYVQSLLERGVECNTRDGAEMTPLSRAASKGNTEIVALLLKYVADPDVDDYNGLKPLHHAALPNHHSIVKLLLDAGVSPLTGKTRDPGRRCGNAPSTIGHSPLMYASQSGSVESVHEMIPFLKPEDITNALCWAARSGRSQVVNLLLALPEVCVDPPGRRDSPLFLAAAGLHLDVMKSLLEKGADPNRKNENVDEDQGIRSFSAYDVFEKRDNLGATALHAVCGINRHSSYRQSTDDNMKKCFNLLLEAGCDIDAMDMSHRTSLHITLSQERFTSKSNDTLANLLIENGANVMALDKTGNTPLHFVKPNTDSAPIIELLIAKGADLSARRPSDGRTPLHTMMDCIHTLNINFLTPYVADWNIKDSNGDTPLHILLSTSYHPNAVASDLLQAGADLNVKNKKGEAPIHVLREMGSSNFGSDVLPTLLGVGADLETKDSRGRTVILRLLAGFNAEKCFNHLAGLGANIHARDNKGNSALHIACAQSIDDKFIKVLIDAGVDPLSTNYAGNTLLHLVLEGSISSDTGKLKATISLLLKHGVNPGAQNHLGQTPLHYACGSLQAQVFGDKEDPMDFLLDSPLGAYLDTADYNGILPIHLAVAISENLVAKLINRKIDTRAVTHEGRTVLHIAARTRQPNVIGLLLEHFSAPSQIDLLNVVDDTGRTALHEACRSGRQESVTLLLRAGADVQIKDKSGLMPLHVCAEFPEENKRWLAAASLASDRSRHTQTKKLAAAGILSTDSRRPLPRDVFNQFQGSRGYWGQIQTENDTVGIREIIRMLMDHGAEISFAGQNGSPIDLAVSNAFAEMVDTLLPHMQQHYTAAVEKKRKWTRRNDPFQERYLVSLCNPIVLESDLAKDGDSSFLCNNLLLMGCRNTLRNLPAMGVDFTPQPGYNNSFLTTLAKYGYSSLLETLGSSISDATWVNGIEDSGHNSRKSVTPLVVTAARRTLPNMDVIRVLVEKFGADVNIQPEVSVYQPGGGYIYRPGETALHIVSKGTHWWHTEAVEYLLAHGANPELNDSKGQTALQIAVSNDHSYDPYRRRNVVQILLEHGANPNAIADTGLTCLNKAMHDVELVRMLITHGADISLGDKPVLFSAITSQNFAALEALLKAGADCNVRQKPVEKLKNAPRLVPNQYEDHEYYPVHYAASSTFNTVEKRKSAIQITHLLLKYGADPFLPFWDDATVIHDIFASGGIMQPFLELPNLDLERHDQKGRTLFLAACQSSSGTSSASISYQHTNWSHEERNNDYRERTIGDPIRGYTLYDMGSNLLAVDNEGNNALHLLLLATPHNNDEFKKAFTIFIEQGPSLVDQKNSAGFTPFHYAIQKRRVWSAEALMNAGANVLLKDPKGNTALHHIGGAIFHSSGDTEWLPWFEKFFALGIPIDEKNSDGETVLFNFFKSHSYTAKSKWCPPFERMGADIFAKNNVGETILHLTAKKVYNPSFAHLDMKPDETETFKYLMERGFDPMTEDNNQRTALDVAAACGNEPIMALFKSDKGGVPSTTSTPEIDNEEYFDL